MKQLYLSIYFLLLTGCGLAAQSTDWLSWERMQEGSLENNEAIRPGAGLEQGPVRAAVSSSQPDALVFKSSAMAGRGPKFRWPWQLARQDYLTWWVKGLDRRLLETFEFRPGVRYVYRNAELGYVADETIIGGEIEIDDDLLNAVDFPSIIEDRLRALRIELPMGYLVRNTSGWTSLAQQELSLAGVQLRATYWSGAMAPRQFPQPGDLGALFDANEFVGLAAREIAATSALNNAISLELNVHPIHLLTGFRRLEWNMDNGVYVFGDFAIGWVKSTDLTFRQGRELLGDVDMGQEIRDVLPDALEALINTNEAGELLLTALESRLPLYGFGLPIATGRNMELSGGVGYHWVNATWSGDARIGFAYQKQRLSNEHPSAPVLDITRWIPSINVKWVFNKARSDGSLFD